MLTDHNIFNGPTEQRANFGSHLELGKPTEKTQGEVDTECTETARETNKFMKETVWLNTG